MVTNIYMHISGQATVEQLRKLLAAAKSKGATLEALPAAALSTVPLWFESQSLTCLTSTNVQILTPEELRARREYRFPENLPVGYVPTTISNARY